MLGGRDEPAAALWAMAQLAAPMAVRVAATLRVADHLAAGPRTAAELAAAVDADAGALERLLRYLAVRGLLSRDARGGYALTARGAPLRDDHPSGVRGWLDLEGAGRAELSFVRLLHSVRTGEAAYPVHFGRSFWEDLAAAPGRKDAFDASMSGSVAQRGPLVASGYDWGAVGHLVDVGGGDGSLLVELLTRFPALRGTLVDSPETAEAARAAFAAAGLDGRAEVAPGSFFDPLPKGAGGYLLSLVLHNWADRDAAAILRRCAEAAGDAGRVFLVEKLNPDGTPHTGMDLRMLAYCGGRERGADELAELAAGAGLRTAALHPAGPLTIAELRPAEGAAR